MNEYTILDPVQEHVLCTSKKLVAPWRWPCPGAETCSSSK